MGRNHVAPSDADAPTLWAIRFHVPEAYADYIAESLDEEVSAISSLIHEASGLAAMELIVSYVPEEAVWKARLYALMAAVGEELPEVTLSEVPKKNWLMEVEQSFVPIQAGRFYIHGTHFKEAIPEGLNPICVDAGQAFGSGEHGTTQGCLEAIDRYIDDLPEGMPVLDVGTGSGILAMALAKAGAMPVIATDIDVVAVRVAEENAKLNEVSRRIQWLEADGMRAEAIVTPAPYSMVVANILARPLMAMAEDMHAVTHENGLVVLSGLLNHQQPEVIGAYEAAGFQLVEAESIGEWSTLVLRPSGN
jgi:ribosomal protein L11 methyltransferase